MFSSAVKSYRQSNIQTLLAKQQEIENQIVNVKSLIAKQENFAFTLLGYPSLEAARTGLRAYGSGQVERELNSLKETLKELSKLYKNEEYANLVKTSEESAENKKLFDNIKAVGESYIKHCDTLLILEKGLRTIRGVLAEKGVVVEHLPKTPTMS